MIRPSASASPAPTALVRRLVLGTAFLVGLAFALVPRTPAVQAQESRPPAAAEAKPAPPASKTLTITDGHGSVSAKIEVSETPPPASKASRGRADPAAGDDPPSAEPEKGADGHRVIVGKHGRVKIEGLGNDREFDSFNEFVSNEPAIAFMVVAIVALVFLAPVLAIGLILWYRFRKNRMLNETMLKLAEQGVVTPADALQALAGGKPSAALMAGVATTPLYEQAKQIRRRAAWSDLRKGVITGGIGLALTLFSLFDDRTPNGVGLVLLFVGIGFVVLWWFEERQLAPGNGAPAGSGSSSQSPGSTPPSA